MIGCEGVKEKESASMLLSSLFLATSVDFAANVETPGGYHIYRDSMGFAYDVNIARADLLEKSSGSYKLRVGKFGSSSSLYAAYSPHSIVRLDRPRAQCLQLFESDGDPKQFSCYVTYSDPKSGTSTYVLAPKPSSYYLAMDQFKQFFKTKTRKEWEARDSDKANWFGQLHCEDAPPLAVQHNIEDRGHKIALQVDGVDGGQTAEA